MRRDFASAQSPSKHGNRPVFRLVHGPASFYSYGQCLGARRSWSPLCCSAVVCRWLSTSPDSTPPRPRRVPDCGAAPKLAENVFNSCRPQTACTLSLASSSVAGEARQVLSATRSGVRCHLSNTLRPLCVQRFGVSRLPASFVLVESGRGPP